MTGTPPASRTSLRARGRSRGEQLPLWHPSTPGSSPGASARCVGSMPEAADAVRYTPNDGPSLPDPPRPGGLPRCPDRGEFSVPIRIHPARRIPLSQTAWPWIADGGVQADEEPTYPDPGPVGPCGTLSRTASCRSPRRADSGPVLRGPGSAPESPPLCVAYGRPQSGGGPGWSRFRTDPGPLPDRRGATPGRPGPRLSGFRQAAKAMPGGVGGCPAEGPSPDHVMSDARPVFGYGEDFLVMPRARSVVSAALPSALRCGFRAEVHCWCFRCVPSCGISVRSPHLSTHPVSLRRGERDESGGDAQDAGSPLWLLRLCPAGTIPFGVCADPS